MAFTSSRPDWMTKNARMVGIGPEPKKARCAEVVKFEEEDSEPEAKVPMEQLFEDEHEPVTPKKSLGGLTVLSSLGIFNFRREEPNGENVHEELPVKTPGEKAGRDEPTMGAGLPNPELDLPDDDMPTQDAATACEKQGESSLPTPGPPEAPTGQQVRRRAGSLERYVHIT